ncbi:MAG: [acyl-carrier-protein] S-malonyltransferase [Gemmatimonadetes bacterium]|nr:[acyl-carrier-protein] S-malonyltransferase [Gemmatimonadota bacterium]
MSITFLFPGQASQYVGMGKDLYDASPAAVNVFDLADRMLDIRIKSFCFCGPEESLRQTAITQPAVFTHSVAALHMLKEAGIESAIVAGHSVGELAALVAAGVIELEDGLRLVSVRAQAMSAAGKTRPGSMAAVIGLDDADVESVCEEASSAGSVRAANYNCPGQLVISGEDHGVKRAIELAKEKGAKRALKLPVSGAFHSDLMKPAVEALAAALNGITFSAPRVPVVPNVTAEPTEDPDELKRLLVEQVVSPVRWTETVTTIASKGISSAYEVGPGSTLKGLVRRIDRNLSVETAGTIEDFEKIGY